MMPPAGNIQSNLHHLGGSSVCPCPVPRLFWEFCLSIHRRRILRGGRVLNGRWRRVMLLTDTRVAQRPNYNSGLTKHNNQSHHRIILNAQRTIYRTIRRSAWMATDNDIHRWTPPHGECRVPIAIIVYVGTIESNVHKQISRHLSEILTSQLDVPM